MKKLSQFLLYTFITLIVVVGGLLAGRHISNMNQLLTEAEVQRVEQQRQEKEIQKLKRKADYEAAPSSYGLFIKIQHINVEYGDDIATALIEKQNADDLQMGQKVILYDKEDETFAMPLGGIINYLNNEDGKRKIGIKLPKATNTDFLSTKVGVIILEIPAVQRIPLSALTQNKEGEKIVWLASQTKDDKFTVNPQRIEIIDKNEEFFIPEGFDIGPYTPIILNPDKSIKRDKEYRLFVTRIVEPVLNPIDQAKVNFDTYMFENRQEELVERADNCAKGIREPNDGATTSADGTTSQSTSCAARANNQNEIFRVFESLPTPTEQTE